MAEHGDELFAEQRGFLVRLGLGLGFGAGFEQGLLVDPPIDRPEQGETGEQVAPVRRALFGGVGDRGHLFAGGGEQVERDLVDVALHPQKRREVGFEGDAAAEAEDVVEAHADERVGRPLEPFRDRPVGLDDAAVGRDRDIAAGRGFVEVLEVFGRIRQIRGSLPSPLRER